MIFPCGTAHTLCRILRYHYYNLFKIKSRQIASSRLTSRQIDFAQNFVNRQRYGRDHYFSTGVAGGGGGDLHWTLVNQHIIFLAS